MAASSKLLKASLSVDKALWTRWMLLDEFLDQRILASSLLKSIDRLTDLAPDSVLEFLGSSLGKGHHQDLMDRKVLFQQKAQEKAGDGVGLPGPCTGLDEVGSFKRSIERIECTGSLSFSVCVHRLTLLEVFQHRAKNLLCDLLELRNRWDPGA